MTSPITDERLKEILDGCEGVTPGPYEHHSLMVVARHETIVHFGISNNFRPPQASRDGR